MKTGIAFKAVFCTVAVAACSACSKVSVEGEWVEPVPGMENMVQGVKMEDGGKASSVNMATLKYETWKRSGEELILTGKSIGNSQTLAFTDTLTIEKLTEDSLVLKQKNGYVHNYARQK